MKFNVIAICETWLNSKVPNSLLLSNFPYTIVRSDRHNKGGGVCIFISHNVVYCQVETPKIPNAEIISIDIHDPVTQSKHRLINVYRPTTCETNQHFTLLLDTLTELCAVDFPVTLVGDFNLPCIDWINKQPTITSQLGIKERLFTQFVTSLDLSQHVNFPTRSNNCLDLLFTNAPTHISHVASLPPFGSATNTSDHVCIECMLEINVSTENKQTTHNFPKADYNIINQILFNINWLFIFSHCTNIDQLYNQFCETIHDVIEMYVPMHKPRTQQMTFPSHINSIIAYRNKLWPHIKYPNVYEKFKKCTLTIDKKVNKYLVNREKAKLKTVKSKFEYVGSHLKSKKAPIPLLKCNDSLISKSIDKAELLSTHFQSTFTNIVPSTEKLPTDITKKIVFLSTFVLSILPMKLFIIR